MILLLGRSTSRGGNLPRPRPLPDPDVTPEPDPDPDPVSDLALDFSAADNSQYLYLLLEEWVA